MKTTLERQRKKIEQALKDGDRKSLLECLARLFEQLETQEEELESRKRDLRAASRKLEKAAETEEALRQSEEKYRGIFTAAKDGIIVVEPESGRILDANPEACRMYGYTLDELKSMRNVDLSVDPEDTAATFRKRRTWVPLRRHRKKDGTVFPVEISVSYYHAGRSSLSTSIMRDITVQKRAERSLRHSEQQLRNLSLQLLEATEEERRKIARELHDSIMQTLTAALYHIESAARKLSTSHVSQEEETIRLLRKLSANIERAVKETRSIYLGLRPPVLDDLGILATLEWFVRGSQRTYPGARITLETRIEESEVPETIKIVIFRVVQEAVKNSMDYGGAQSSKIRLAKRNGSIELAIEDDGAGFDLEQESDTGWGTRIASMKERTELSGGRFSIESAAGKGTTVRAVWFRGSV